MPMPEYKLKRSSVPLDDSWDVIVGGGGPAGCAAATAAAREGAKTLLVEATGCLGGMSTAGLVNCWGFGDGKKWIIRGLGEKILKKYRAGAPPEDQEVPHGRIDPEMLKRVYDEVVGDSGAQILFNTRLALVENRSAEEIGAILTCDKSGLIARRAKVYVDCTADGDLAAWAGAPFEKGDPADGETMPVTLCFILTNVDEAAFHADPRLWETVMPRALESGRFPEIPDTFIWPIQIGPRTIGCNAGHQWHVDSADPGAISTAMIQGRRIARAFRDALAEFHPAFREAFLVNSAALLGCREGRRIVGDYVLSYDDYVARRKFPDEICRHHSPIDIHMARNQKEGRFEQYRPGDSYGIPYRCLTPRGLRNILTAGRCISCDRTMLGSVRMMGCCVGMGEAAGLAAALAAGSPTPDVHAVDIRRLRRRLQEHGAYLPEPFSVDSE